VIGVVTTSYPRFAGDSAGHFVAAHVEALRAQGHDVEVLAAGDGAGRIPSRLFYRGGAPDMLELGPALSFTARMTLAVARKKWSAIIAHWLAPSAIAALPSRVPLLAIAHGGDIHTLQRTRLLAPVLQLLRLRGARLAFVSRELREIALAAAPSAWLERSIVQPMGIDVARFARLERIPSRTVLVAARLVDNKGVDVAIEAMRGIDAELVVAGDGPLRAKLEAIDPKVTFVGQVDASARDQLLRRAAVVVIPSRHREGTPMIALEALAAGVPVVASRIGGLVDLPIRHVAADQPAELAAAITEQLAAPAARVNVDHLDWSAVGRRLGAYVATP